MTGLVRRIRVGCVLAASLALAAGCAKEKPTTGTIAGFATLADASAHAGTFVTLGDQLALTKPDGAFRFEKVVPGPALLRFVRDGYVSQERTVTVVAGQSAEVTLQLERPVAPDRPPFIASLSAAPPELAPGGSAKLLLVANDPDGDALAYAWSAEGGFTVGAGSTPGEAVLTAPDAPGASGKVTVIVDDGRGGAATASIVVSTAGNRPPVVSSLTAVPPTAAPGGTIALVASASDPEGTSLSYAWSAPPGWTVSGTGAAVSVTAPARYGQTGTVGLVVTDAWGGIADASIVVSTVANAGPAISSITATPAVVAKGGTIALSASAADPNGDPLTYAWSAPAGWTITGSGAAVTVTAPAAPGATATISLLVSDPSGAQASGGIVVSTAANAAPIVASLTASPQATSRGGTIQLAASAADPDGDALAYQWSVSDPDWAIAGTGANVAITAPDGYGKSATVTLVVSDGLGGSTTATVPVATAANAAPVVSALVASPPVTSKGGTIALSATAVDPNGDALTYTWSAPAGWTITGSGSDVTVTAPATPGATALVDLTVDDGFGGSTQSAILVSTAANAAPAVASLTATPPLVAKGGTLALTVSAADPDGDTLSYTWSAPGGWTLTSAGATATLVAPSTPSTAGVVSVTVDDGFGGTVTSEVAVATQPNAPPVLSTLTASPSTVFRGATVNLSASASDADGDALSYAWSVSDPAWTLSGTGANVTVTAPDAYSKSATVSLVVTDGFGGSVSGGVPVATYADRAPEITSVPPPGQQPTAGRTTWSYQVSAADPDGDALSYSLSGAPASASISPGGLVTWRPKRNEAAYAFDVRVSDGNLEATQQLQGSVAPFAMRAAPSSSTIYGYEEKVVSDFNGDGKPDVASVDWNGQLYLAPGTSSGLGAAATVVPAQSGYDCYTLAAADVNGDGKSDVVIACSAYWNGTTWLYQPTVVTFLNDGTGQFTRSALSTWAGMPGWETYGMALADLNGDGKPDLVTALSNEYVLVWLNDGAGGFTPTSSRDYGNEEFYSAGVFVRDFNGDGKPDIAFAGQRYNSGTGYWEGTVTILPTDGSGVVNAATEKRFIRALAGVHISYRSLAALDLNGDGVLDLVAGAAGTNAMELLLNDGTGTLTLKATSPLACVPWHAFVGTGDLDGDGNQDVVSGDCSGTGSYVVYFGDGAGGVDQRISLPFTQSGYASYSVSVADWNGDGLPDVYVSSSSATTYIQY